MLGGDKETLRLLATHATILANVDDSSEIDIGSLRKLNTPLGNLENAFMTYIEALEEANLPQSYLQNLQDPATIAFWRFWNEHDKYQKSLKREIV
jgi:hypothetical protein